MISYPYAIGHLYPYIVYFATRSCLSCLLDADSLNGGVARGGGGDLRLRHSLYEARYIYIYIYIYTYVRVE